jgi:hypothetical protein
MEPPFFERQNDYYESRLIDIRTLCTKLVGQKEAEKAKKDGMANLPRVTDALEDISPQRDPSEVSPYHILGLPELEEPAKVAGADAKYRKAAKKADLITYIAHPPGAFTVAVPNAELNSVVQEVLDTCIATGHIRCKTLGIRANFAMSTRLLVALENT